MAALWDWCDEWTDAAEILALAGRDPADVVPLAELVGAEARRPRWWADAACRGLGELFFDDSRVGEAAVVCARCPVAGDCERWARRKRPEGGVWAGQRLPALPKPGTPPCGNCGSVRRLVARGLCDGCYKAVRRTEPVMERPPPPRDRACEDCGQVGLWSATRCRNCHRRALLDGRGPRPSGT